MRDANINARLELIQSVLETQTSEYWLSRLDAEGVPCAPVLTRNQLITDSQVRASGILIETDHIHAGRLRQARAAAKFDKTPTAVRQGAPLLGEHSTEILLEMGFNEIEIDRLRGLGAIGD